MLINFRAITTSFFVVVGLCSCVKTAPSKPARLGNVNWKAVVDPGQPRYVLNPDQVATDVTPVDHVAVEYPPELAAQDLPPIDVRVKVIVGTDGEVGEVRSIDPAVLRDAVAAAFFRAVVGAVGKWHYNPLVISDWVQESDGSMHRVAAKTVSFSMDYIFHFEIVRGVPAVTESRKQSAATGS